MSPARRAAALAVFVLALPAAAADPLPITARVRTGDAAAPADERRAVDPARCAVVICDMWDDHWCASAATRCDVLARQAAPVIAAARARGMTIVHAPSDCMGFYKDHPARVRTLALPAAEVPPSRDLPNPPLPIDDSDGGCDDVPPAKFRKAWTRQHAAIAVDPDKDFVTDSGKDLLAVMKARNLDTVFVLGVHTNMCVLHRSFAIKQLRRWGVTCYLVRDLTDAMYNPEKAPKVPHADGTRLVVEFIERHWCPSVASADLLGGK